MRSSTARKSALGYDVAAGVVVGEPVGVMTPLHAGNPSGTVLRIERSSVHDGAGFRTVVFFKGCPLRCLWCSTPESQSAAVESGADETYGAVMVVEQIMAEVRKDSVFYFHSGGGLTLSGGEPLVQADFAAALLRQAHSEGINTAIETSLAVPFGRVEKVLPHLDTVYADIKHIDPAAHKRCCGADNAVILENIRKVDAWAGGGLRLIVRVPIIPGINDTLDALNGIGAFCARLRNLHCVQLLPYHRLGVDTYRKLGRSYPLAGVLPPDAAHMEACRGVIRNYVDAC